MPHLCVSPKVHKALLNETRRRDSGNLLTLASYGAGADPDALVLSLSVAAKPTKGAAAAARFDPVIAGYAIAR
jgi:hypothetical protein